MNVVKEIQRINQREIVNGTWSDTGSWHAQYKNSAWIFVGNIPFELTEGDVVCIFSQFGEIIHVEVIRDQKTGKSKGFAFLQYEDQRSTILAVDNLNGAQVLGRTLRVDHSHTGPRKPKKKEEEEEEDDDQPKMNVAPQYIEVKEKEEKKVKQKPIEMDEEDPMAAYFRDKHEKKSKKKSKKDHKSSREDRHSASHRHRSKSPARHRTRSRSPRRHRSRSRSPHRHRRHYRSRSP